MSIQFTSQNFQEQVLNNDQPVLVDFWAQWCPPCRALGPTIDELADDLAGEATVGKLNIDEHQELASEYGVTSIPTILIFKDGEIAERLVGVNDKERYEKAIQSAA